VEDFGETTAYTAVVKGGTGGVKDLAGNPMIEGQCLKDEAA
jgi:hypothetical protein